MSDVLSGSLLLAPAVAALDGELRAGLDQLQRLAFHAVQLSAAQEGSRPRDLDRSARRDLLAALRRRELELAGIDLWIPAGHFTDHELVDRALAAVNGAIQLAAELERCPLSLILPGTDDAESIRETIIASAVHHGVTLVDHDLDAAPLAGNVVLRGIDPAAWLAADRDPVEGIAANPGSVGSARLVDLLRTGMRGPVGDAHDGRLEVQAYRVALEVGGYNRPVVVDARQWNDVPAGLQQSAAAWGYHAGS